MDDLLISGSGAQVFGRSELYPGAGVASSVMHPIPTVSDSHDPRSEAPFAKAPRRSSHTPRGTP
jgi:hypothetical protein